jgi:hypothetical protein
MGDLPILHVYMDESGQTQSRYMCVSGIVVRRERVTEVRAGIERIKAAGDIGSEVKWSKVTAHRVQIYKTLVEYFFGLVRENQAQCTALICDFSDFDHRKAGGREANVSRMLFQLSLHRLCRKYGARADLHLFPDSGDCGDQLCGHRYHLNNAARRYMPDGRKSAERPVAHIEATNSADEHLLQLNDLILGAIGYRRNERYEAPEAAKHKKSLARLVAQRCEATTFHYNPKTFGRRFTVWNFKDPTKLKLGRGL